MHRLLRAFFQNARKPDGAAGKVMLWAMNWGHASLAKWGRAHVSPEPDARVLDIGCGGGANLAQFLKLCPQGHVCGIDFSTERRSNRCLPFRIGYACYVCCEVQRDGKEVQVKSADGEADYYLLSATWMVSSIERSFLKAKASLYSDTDDIENDMKELFRLLSNDQ